jgi:hypothetical protein
MEASQGWTPRPQTLVTVVVTPRTTLGDAADVVADRDVTLASPSVLEQIADRAVLAISHLRGLPATLTDEQLAQHAIQQFSEQRLDTANLVRDLSRRPLRNGT